MSATPAAPSRLDTIGRLTVTDNLGIEHTVTIRREDLTTTNGAYRAVRDEVVDTLRTVLLVNRCTSTERDRA